MKPKHEDSSRVKANGSAGCPNVTPPEDAQDSLIVDGAGLVWRGDRAWLEFRIGPFEIGRIALPAECLATSCLRLPMNVIPPPWRSLPRSCQAILCPGLPVQQDMRLLSFAHGSIRYVLRQENRYFVDLEGSHDAYLAKFSAKTRNTFRRHLRRFSDAAGGSITWTTHRTPDELRAFHADAIRISRDSHQHGIGYGLPDKPDFVDRLADDAAQGRVRGYLLFHHGTPAAYALCPIADSVMSYARLGYAPSLEELSPGRILLLLILEKLFAEKPVQYLDFGAQEFTYKSHFATNHIRTARVLYLRPNAGNAALMATHAAVRGVWHALSEVRGLVRKFSRALTGRA
jgi:hypothetical protein